MLAMLTTFSTFSVKLKVTDLHLNRSTRQYEVEERLRAHSEASEVVVSSDEDAISTDVPEVDDWCTCEQCVHIENMAERPSLV